MKYLSVCSGIEAATVAWHTLGFKPVAFSEIEKFPCSVLAHHYPDTPNYGDMTKFKEWPQHDIDILVGGTPCQSFSIAGLRKGLDDPRGNLMLTYFDIAAKYRPRWVVWENVPGVLSSNGGRDFATFLEGLAQCGYGFAYRVLDAQFVRTDGYPYAVPQRRRRVFVVGHLGDWRRAAAVLFDSESLRGNPPPRREAGKEVAARTAQSAFQCGGIGSYLSGDVSSPLLKTGADLGNGCEALIAHSLRGEGFDASEDGTGRGTPIVTCMAHDQGGAEITDGYAPTLNCNHEQPIALVGNAIGREPHNGGNGNGFDESGAMYTLTKTDRHAVAFGVNEKPDLAHCLRSGASKADKHESTTYIADTLTSNGDAHSGFRDEKGIIHQAMKVRRLTPIECARLQGFPDTSNSVIISVSKNGETECLDHQKQNALAETQCLKLQNVVNHVGRHEPSQSNALFAEKILQENSINHSELAAVHVRLHLEAGTLEILNPKKSFSSASLAEKKSSFRQHTKDVNTARQLALILRELEKKAQTGKVELLQRTRNSTCLQNGNLHVCECGKETEDFAKNAESTTNIQNEHSMFTILEASQNSQNSDQKLQTLCCSVLNAIASFIPEKILNENFYEINLEIVQGYLHQVNGPSDSAMYKALGNSMAVNAMQLIGERIQMADEMSSAWGLV